MRIVVTGPESSGKTQLATYLSEAMGIPLIPEYAREYIGQLSTPYVQDDLDAIALRQKEEKEATEGKTVILDTDLLTTIIWYKEKYHKVPKWMKAEWVDQKDTIYLICKPDIPWEADPQREHPKGRVRLYERYFHYLMSYEKEFYIIKGQDFNNRCDEAMKLLNYLLALQENM